MLRGAVAAGTIAALAAAAASAAAPYKAPRTRFGAPDLEGAWSSLSLTHLERPPGVAEVVVSAAEVARLEARLRAEGAGEGETGGVGQLQTEWPEAAARLGVVDGQVRTAWLTDPADGKLPYSEAGRRALGASWGASLDGPESLSASDRCLSASWSASGPPMLNAPGSANYRIAQTPTEVVIVAEMHGDVRTIRMGEPHPPPSVRLWGGHSSGRWEGDTLVVETANFHPGESFRPPIFYMSPDARVTERFTRTGPDTIRYAFSVDDPKTFTRTWKGELPLRRTDARMFEFACHEGNYSLPGILGGALRQERDGTAAGPPRAR